MPCRALGHLAIIDLCQPCPGKSIHLTVHVCIICHRERQISDATSLAIIPQRHLPLNCDSTPLFHAIIPSTPSHVTWRHSWRKWIVICDIKSRQKGVTRSGWRSLGDTSGAIQIGEPDLDFNFSPRPNCNLLQQATWHCSSRRDLLVIGGCPVLALPPAPSGEPGRE